MSTAPQPAETGTGILSAVGAYTIWGLLPVFLIALRGVLAEEVLIHRVLWSVPFGALIIMTRRQWPDVRAALNSPKVMRALLASSFVIAINWLVYILAVQNGRIFEASLGYYINPLIYVLVGVVILGERLTAAQKAAVAMAAVGVGILTVYGGRFPAVSLILGVSFTAYGYIRKTAPVGAMPGLFIETLVLAPLALLWALVFLPEASAFATDASTTLLLIAAGPVTVMPLLLFAIGARRLPLSTIGFLQFIGPTLQFIVGLIDGEAFTAAHQLCFAFIWTAAGIFAVDAFRRARWSAAAKAASAGEMVRAESGGAPEGERGERRPA